MPASVSTAILVVVFNRPHKTRALVDQLLAFDELDILVAADGPRSEAERMRTDEVRAIVGELAGRHRLETRFADRNLGCGTNVSEGIRWALQRHEQLIIVEDDIRISREFLTYCNQGLASYRDREDVLCISSGPLMNLDPAAFPPSFLTRYPNIWGWATWRRAFADYSITLEGRTIRDLWRVLGRTFPGRRAHQLYFLGLLLLVRTGRIDTWDFQFYFLAWEKRAFALSPARGLAQNIGFDADATHTRRAPDNVARMAAGVDDPIALATAPAEPNETYNRLVERDLWHIGFYRAARFALKYVLTRPKRYATAPSMEPDR